MADMTVRLRQKLATIAPYKALGMELRQAGRDEVSLRIALGGNTNDKGTMFAGSTYSAMVLCGWCLAAIRVWEEDPGMAVVIASSDSRYRRPLRSPGIAVARVAGAPRHKENGNVAVRIAVTLLDHEQQLCAWLDARYVGVAKTVEPLPDAGTADKEARE